MTDISFTTIDFENLAYIEEFNKEHWKGTLKSLGWKYDLGQDSPEIARIRDSLHEIKNKLDQIRTTLAANPQYEGLESFVQKVTSGMTNRYISHPWLSFIKKIENKPPNEPQLQVGIKPNRIEAILWFENRVSVHKYFIKVQASFTEKLKAEEEIEFHVYEKGISDNRIGIYDLPPINVPPPDGGFQAI